MGRSDNRTAALVVLDDLGERRFVTMLLRSIGFTNTEHVESYDKARDALITTHYDLVLTDWAVNREPMQSFLQQVRAFPTTERSAVPFIMFTSHASQRDVTLARELGVDAYLIRPVSRGVFIERINAALEAKRPFIRSAGYVGPCRRRMIDLTYSGPMRRLSDPAESLLQDILDSTDRTRVRTAFSMVQTAAHNIVKGDRNSMRTLFSAINEMKVAAASVNDTIAAEVAGHLNRYIEAVGATDRLSRDVVLTNCEALRHIVQTPMSRRDARARMAKDVERMITKKIRQASAPSNRVSA